VSSSAPIAKVSQQESRFGKQAVAEVHIGFAVHLLGIDSNEVVRLCKTGALRARCNRHGTWRIDEAFLVRWHAANPSTGAAGAESNEGEKKRALARLAARPPCPSGACEGHWERRGQVVPAFRVGLCQRCYSGRSLSVKRDGDASMD
jgi:hypothetical protein